VEPKPNGKLQAVNVTSITGSPLVSDGCPLNLEIGVKTDEGQKETNEDRYVSEIEFGQIGSFFGVYDGHNGSGCSKYVAKHLHKNVLHAYGKHRNKEDPLHTGSNPKSKPNPDPDPNPGPNPKILSMQV